MSTEARDTAVILGFIIGSGAVLIGIILFFVALNGQLPIPHPVVFSIVLTLSGAIAVTPGIRELL